MELSAIDRLEILFKVIIRSIGPDTAGGQMRAGGMFERMCRREHANAKALGYESDTIATEIDFNGAAGFNSHPPVDQAVPTLVFDFNFAGGALYGDAAVGIIAVHSYRSVRKSVAV